jgi:hypothetical protein
MRDGASEAEVADAGGAEAADEKAVTAASVAAAMTVPAATLAFLTMYRRGFPVDMLISLE